MIKKLLTIISALIAVFIIRCSSSPVADGDVTETGNAKVASTVYNKNGEPASGASVRIRPVDFLKDTSSALAKIQAETLSVFTDEHGWFELDSIDTGEYYIEINLGDSQAIIIDLYVGGDTILPQQNLDDVAELNGTVASNRSSTYLQIYGLDRVFKTDTSGAFKFSNLPALFSYTLRVVPAGMTYKPTNIQVSTSGPGTVVEAGTINIATALNENYSAWNRALQIYLKNQSVAQITENVHKYPLLIEIGLPADSIVGDGTDIRFVKENGMPLPFEVELWDPGDKGIVWVLIDTVFAHTDSQSITMYWDNPDAIDRSDGAAVFRTSDGFAGVWHLADTSLNTGDITGFKDATSNENHGTDYVTSDNKNYLIGAGQFFESLTGDYIDCGSNSSLEVTDQSTISFWIFPINIKAPVTIPIMSKKSIPGSSSGFEIEFSIPDSLQNIIKISIIGSDTASVTAGDSTFNQAGVFCTITLAGGVAEFFLEGTKIHSQDFQTPISDGAPLLMGKNAAGSTFNGFIDEIRLSNIIRNDSWIKLSHVNQRIPKEYVTAVLVP